MVVFLFLFLIIHSHTTPRNVNYNTKSFNQNFDYLNDLGICVVHKI